VKKFLFFFALCCLCNNLIIAQDDDLPYLTDDDIAALEMLLPYDMPELPSSKIAENTAEAKHDQDEKDISRLNTSMRIFHLLVLDRSACSSDADITKIDSANILYKYKDGLKGYLIAIYTSPQKGPVFPQLPDNSYIILNLTTVHRNTISDYVNSDEFKKFVTSNRIISEIKNVILN